MNKLNPFFFLIFGILLIPIATTIDEITVKLIVLAFSALLLIYSVYLFGKKIKEKK
jgi:membrane protein implicated in regulation of membrane protease activity